MATLIREISLARNRGGCPWMGLNELFSGVY